MPDTPPDVAALLAHIRPDNAEFVQRWANALAQVPGLYQRIGDGARVAMARTNVLLMQSALGRGNLPMADARKFVDSPIYQNQPLAEFVQATLLVDQAVRDYLSDFAPSPDVARAAMARVHPILAAALSNIVQMREARHSTAGLVAEMGAVLRDGIDAREAAGSALGKAARALGADLFVVTQVTPHDVRLFATSQPLAPFGVDDRYVWSRDMFPRLSELELGSTVARPLEADRAGPETLLVQAGFTYGIARPLFIRGSLVGFLSLIYRQKPPEQSLPDHELACIEPLIAAHVAFAYHATALGEADAAIQTLFDRSPNMLVALDRRGRVLRANTPFMERIGVHDGLIGMPLSWLIHPSWLDRYQQLWIHITQSVVIEQSRVDLLTTHSERLPVVIEGRWLESPGELCLMAITDVSEHVARHKVDEQRIDDLTAFAHHIAHDLRHPLRTIAGFGAMLQEDLEAAPDRVPAHVQRIIAAAERGNAMVTGLLQFARTPKQRLESADISLGSLVASTHNNFQAMLEEGRVKLTCVGADDPVFLGDAAALQALVNNLVDNAIQHGERQCVTVEFSGHPSDAGWAELWVRDDGVGIAAEDQGRIFEVFVRGESRNPGSGVGLAIVRRLAEGHGGSVILESDVGQGCLFRVRLPAS